MGFPEREAIWNNWSSRSMLVLATYRRLSNVPRSSFKVNLSIQPIFRGIDLGAMYQGLEVATMGAGGPFVRTVTGS